MPFRPSRLIVPVLLLAAAVGGYLWWRDHQKPEPITFTTTTVTRGTLTQSVTATGDLQPVETVEVSSQISGLITEVAVDYNTRVKAGDVLARLDPATYQSRVNSAEAELANTRANHRLVSLNAERIKSLHERNLVSQQELDQAVAQLAQAEAQLQIRTAAVETAKVDLSRCIIKAPIDGIILDRPAIAGKTVSASTSAPVLFVLVNDLSLLQIKAAVAEADIGNVKEGQPVTFTVDAFPNQAFRGIVRQIRNQPVTQSNVVTYATLIDVRNEDLTLKPGMTANVSITIQERADILLVPNAALRARIPDEAKLPLAVKESAPGTAAPAAASPEDAFRALLAEAGYVASGDSRPTREQIQKARALATERGIPIPERRGGGGGGAGGRRSSAETATTETVRTLFTPAGTDEDRKAQAIEVRLGITDGLNTEVISGLEEKAVLITGVADATSKAPAAGARNPFAPSGGMGGRRF
jgi:HlyD family secretion protein